jgi:hypothetical protein
MAVEMEEIKVEVMAAKMEVVMAVVEASFCHKP